MAPGAGRAVFDVERIAPCDELAEFVDYHWLVRWHDAEDHVQRVIPQPRVHVAAEGGRLVVHGILRRPFTRTLSGTGHVLGTAFHPAGFRPLLGSSVAALTDTERPAGDVLGTDDRPTARRILAPADPDATATVAAMERYLLRTEPRPDPTAREVSALVAAAEQRTVTRVDQLARLAGVSVRTLQRRFTEYVGVGPKWVIQRLRVLEAAGEAHAPAPTDWSALAAALGFSDQAHLVRVFSAIVGAAPGTYERDPRTAGRP